MNLLNIAGAGILIMLADVSIVSAIADPNYDDEMAQLSQEQAQDLAEEQASLRFAADAARQAVSLPETQETSSVEQAVVENPAPVEQSESIENSGTATEGGVVFDGSTIIEPVSPNLAAWSIQYASSRYKTQDTLSALPVEEPAIADPVQIAATPMSEEKATPTLNPNPVVESNTRSADGKVADNAVTKIVTPPTGEYISKSEYDEHVKEVATTLGSLSAQLEAFNESLPDKRADQFPPWMKVATIIGLTGFIIINSFGKSSLKRVTKIVRKWCGPVHG